MSVRKLVVRGSCVVSSVVAIAIAAGCGGPVSQDSASSSSEALATGCSAVPFTHTVCGEGTGGSSSTLEVGHPGLTTEFGGQGFVPTDPCQCESLVSPAQYGRKDLHLTMTCYASPTAPSPRLAPPGPAGCTAGVTLTYVNGMPGRDGTIATNTWVCPPGTTIPSNLGAAPTCDSDPFAAPPGTWPSSGTSSQCEYIYWGTQNHYGNDCFGDPTGGYFLVQERIFTTVSFDAGSNQGDGGCTAMCCMPIGGGSGGGVLPPVGKAAQ
jgi:hypothetical protein